MIKLIKEILKFILLPLLIFLVITFFTGHLGLFYKEYFGIRHKEIDRNIYESSKSYVKGAAQDLAQYKYEYDKASNESDREAIKGLIRSRFADLDVNKLDSLGLRVFLTESRGY